MPIYRAKVKILLSHESRVIEEGTEFTTVFPKVKVDGKLVDMKLGSNLELIGYSDEEQAELNRAKKEAEREARLAAEAEADRQADAEREKKRQRQRDEDAAEEAKRNASALNTEAAPALNTVDLDSISTEQAPAMSTADLGALGTGAAPRRTRS